MNDNFKEIESSYEDFFSSPQFSIATDKKNVGLLARLNALDRYHQENSLEYARIVRSMFPSRGNFKELADLPYLPVSLFKRMELSSVSADNVFKVLHSSGTTGAAPSRVVLDRHTARLQTLALKHTMTTILGQRRLPMLIVDSESIVSSDQVHSARAAGVIGMMNFGRDYMFALHRDGQLNLDGVILWLKKYADQPIFVFGFTAIVWHHLLQNLEKPLTRSAPVFLVHGGGWKRLAGSAVSSQIFKERARTVFGPCQVHDYYGMVEQIGSVYLECREGFLHAPNFSSVIVRDVRTLKPLAPGMEGLIQVLSLLPQSYPGHSILTEDLGMLGGFDKCICGWRGPFFTVKGRLKRAELRGCSDTATIL